MSGKTQHTRFEDKILRKRANEDKPQVVTACCTIEIHFTIVEKYIWQFREIHFAIWRNSVIRLDNAANDLHIHPYSLLHCRNTFDNCEEIYLAIWRNTVLNLEKCILQFEQNTFPPTSKYPFRYFHLEPPPAEQSKFISLFAFAAFH